MATEAAVHVRNLESSILFMQQQHAVTLKALHEEIQKLQKRCTDLTFQLTMHGINVQDESDVSAELQEVQRQLKVYQSKESQLKLQLSQRDQKVQQLEQEFRIQKKRHLDEMRNSAHNISSLKADLEAKSNNIAFLTTELHRLKLKSKMDAERQGVIIGDSEATIIRRTLPQHSHLPAPPKDMLSYSGRIRHRGSHTVTSPSVRRVGALPSASVISVNSAEDLFSQSHAVRNTSTLAHSSSSGSPDISPFVHRDLVVSVPVVEVKKPAPLPPIAATSCRLREKDVHFEDVNHLIITQHGRGRGMARTQLSTPEVTTLAVDQVTEANWKRPTQSHSSEYN